MWRHTEGVHICVMSAVSVRLNVFESCSVVRSKTLTRALVEEAHTAGSVCEARLRFETHSKSCERPSAVGKDATRAACLKVFQSTCTLTTPCSVVVTNGHSGSPAAMRTPLTTLCPAERCPPGTSCTLTTLRSTLFFQSHTLTAADDAYTSKHDVGCAARIRGGYCCGHTGPRTACGVAVGAAVSYSARRHTFLVPPRCCEREDGSATVLLLLPGSGAV